MTLKEYGGAPDYQESTEYQLPQSEAAVKPAAEATKKDPISFAEQIKANQANSRLYKAPTGGTTSPGAVESVVFKKNQLGFDISTPGLQMGNQSFDLAADPLASVSYVPSKPQAGIEGIALKKEPGGKFDQKIHDKSEMTLKTLNSDVIGKIQDPEIKDMVTQIINPQLNEKDTVELTRKLQGKIGANPDGAFGPKSLAALETKYPPVTVAENKAKKMTEAEKVAYDEKMGRQMAALAKEVNDMAEKHLKPLRDGLEIGVKNPKYHPDQLLQMEHTIAMIDMRLAGKPATVPNAKTEQVAAKTAVKETTAASTEGTKA